MKSTFTLVILGCASIAVAVIAAQLKWFVNSLGSVPGRIRVRLLLLGIGSGLCVLTPLPLLLTYAGNGFPALFTLLRILFIFDGLGIAVLGCAFFGRKPKELICATLLVIFGLIILVTAAVAFPSGK